MLEALAFLAVGLLLLIRGADVFIDNAIGLAREWGVSTHVIGVSLVAFATSLPEVLVSLLAGTRGHEALALGNIIGSNMSNLGLVLACACLLCWYRYGQRILPAAGCSQIAIQDLQISDFLPMVEDSLKEPFASAGIPINIKCPAEIPPILADPSRLKDIFLELLANAAEAATEGGGQASFAIYKPGAFSPIEENRVDILIRNSGTAIAVENMEKIWEPFYSSKDNKHLGVGLTTAAVLAIQMNMKLGAHSADNVTTFWLSSPVA